MPRPTGPYCHVITFAKGASSSQQTCRGRAILEPGADVGGPRQRDGPRGAARQVEQSSGERALERVASTVVVTVLARKVGHDDEEGGRWVGDVFGHGAAGLLMLAEAALDQADAREQPHERRLVQRRWGQGLLCRLAASHGCGLGVRQAAGEQCPRRVEEADGPLGLCGSRRGVRGRKRGVGGHHRAGRHRRARHPAADRPPAGRRPPRAGRRVRRTGRAGRARRNLGSGAVRRRQGTGTFAGDADRQRQGTFADADRVVIVRSERGRERARITGVRGAQRLLRRSRARRRRRGPRDPRAPPGPRGCARRDRRRPRGSATGATRARGLTRGPDGHRARRPGAGRLLRLRQPARRPRSPGL